MLTYAQQQRPRREAGNRQQRHGGIRQNFLQAGAKGRGCLTILKCRVKKLDPERGEPQQEESRQTTLKQFVYAGHTGQHKRRANQAHQGQQPGS